MHAKMLRIFCLIAFISVTFGQSEPPSEAGSMFDWVYNTIDKLVALKQDNTRQDSKIKQLETKLEDALNIIDELNSTLNSKRTQGSSGGSTYVRWGKSSCPSGVHKVYDGFAAGSYFDYTGNGANFLCFPRNPIWGNYNPSDGPSAIHGVDYKIGGEYQDHEAPCVVCWIPRTSVRMIPARNECPFRWTMEYHGQLAASHLSHHRSEYICLDEYPETVAAEANKDGNGAYLYYVETRCGSLPCDTYPRGRELTCAVCSYSPSNTNSMLYV